MNIEHHGEWMQHSESIDHLEIEICFQLSDRLYMGDPNNIRQIEDDKFYEEIKLPSFSREVETMARTSEVISNEQELVNYYKTIADYSSSQGLDFNEVRQYFWLRLWLWNTEKEVHISFPWYDTLSEMQSFFSWLQKSPETEPFEDMDQCWQFDAVVKDDRVYLRQSDPDNDEEHANVSISLSVLEENVIALEKRASSIIKILREELGVDVWTSYLKDAKFGNDRWQPKEYGPTRYKASFFRRLMRLD